MTKVGEGNDPKKLTNQDYHKQLDQSAIKFENALISYQSGAADSDEKTRLKAVMDDQLALIQSAIQELKRGGIYKQGEKVKSDYQDYLNSGSVESFAALEHDIQTLREYNQLP